jgi:chromosome segregation ATPase
VDGDWAVALHEHERQKQEVLGEVERAKLAWRDADLTWRQHRVEAATARVELVRCEREYARARAVDHVLLGDDVYADVAQFRGQLARVQERWYAVSSAATAARDALERASAKLASVKEAYAQLMRSGPAVPASLDDHRLQLTDWSATDRRRRVPRSTTYLVVGDTIGQRYLKR